MNVSYKPEGKYNTSPNEININKSKLTITSKPMIVLDNNRIFYTLACKTNFIVEGSKYSKNNVNIFQKDQKSEKSIF